MVIMNGAWSDPARRATDRGGSGGDVDPPAGLTRMTVNLTPRAMGALEWTCGRTGENKTDVINRALQVLAVVHDMLERNDGRSLVVVQPDGRSERVYVL